MKKLQLRLEQNSRTTNDALNPQYPMLAVCYSRFGLVRLALKKGSRKK